MSDPVPSLLAKHQPPNRYSNFGAMLRSLKVSGFRGIADLDIQIECPVTALCGANGSGKSTVLQLMSCAYRKPTTATNYRRYHVREFFPFSRADPTPFTDSANVIFSYDFGGGQKVIQ